jgi:hypothetical protein
VWGLSLGEAYQAGVDFGKALDARVEVIPADWIGPRLRAAVDTEGVDVTARGAVRA